MSDRQLIELSKLILEHPALPELRERVQHRLFARFRKANPQEREIINYIMDNEDLFYTELAIIRDENANIEGDNDEQ